MAGLIPQDFIDDILARVNIVDIISARLTLKRTGSNLKACCPFHQEKTPSFTVNEAKQFYYCFGCGATGNTIGFLMEYDNCTFPEAVETLASSLGLEVPKETTTITAPIKQHTPLFDSLREAQQFFNVSLRNHPKAATAIQYLKQRGLSGEIARDYGIGFAPPGWRNLLDFASSKPKDLIEAGLIIENEDKQYDRFRNRITFPIKNTKGQIIGFGGRVLSKEDQPKYLNSPETPVFNKGKELYGLHEAKKFNRRLNQLLVTEGYMDVIALAQHGIHYGVATLGTAIGSAHLQIIFKYCKHVTFCFDGDNAGRKAAKKALEVSLPLASEDKRIQFMFLPEGHDPDSLVREIGKDAFEQRISKSLPLSEFLFESAAEGEALDTVDQRARFNKRAKQLIQLLPEGDYQSLMTRELAQRTGMSSSNDTPAAPAKTETFDHHNQQPIEAHIPPPLENTETTEFAQRSTMRKETHKANVRSPITKLCLKVLQSPQLAAHLNVEEIHSDDEEAITWLNSVKSKLSKNPQLRAAHLFGYTHKFNDSSFTQKLLKQETLWQEKETDKQEFEDIYAFLRQQPEKHKIDQEIAAIAATPPSELSDEQKQKLRQLLQQKSRIKS